ncbi:unnamed protein product [marine sediment metagenome]|uniref:SAP domain-containing protein n=1 Tax=marine sediment metagenome TaxID=412755 RepID=X0UQ57_9ZZZZ
MCHKTDPLVEALVRHCEEKHLRELAEKAGLGPCTSKLELAMRVAEHHYDDFKWDGKKYD